MYEANIIAGLVTVAASMYRFRNPFHPQVLMTAMFAYMFILNYAVDGSDHAVFSVVPPESIWVYQLSILVFYVLVWGVTMVLSERWVDARLLAVSDEAIAGFLQLTLFAFVALLILALEVTKRLYFANWSLDYMIELSEMSRGSQPWNYAIGNIGDGNFVFAIIGMFVPLSGMLFGYLSAVTRHLWRLIWAVCFVLTMLLVIADGSRTPVFIMFATVGFCYWRFSNWPRSLKIGLILLAAFAALYASTIMYQFRSSGLDQILAAKDEGLSFVYHQDDNYYQALNSLDIASTTDERWSAVQFFWTVIVNPIPRYFWAAKPVLLSDFWGNYKLEWITISFIGELAAMFGPYLGLLLAVAYSIAMFWLLARALRIFQAPGGLIIYLLLALYVYMTLRSLQNLTAYSYILILALGLLYLNKIRVNTEKYLQNIGLSSGR